MQHPMIAWQGTTDDSQVPRNVKQGGRLSRDDAKKVEPGGFIEYGKEQLPKVDSMRRDKSQPSFAGIPIISDEAVMLTRASEMGGKPASCYTCQAQQSDETCFYMGPSIRVSKVKGTKDSGEQIEYWPCCGMHSYGEPRKGKVYYSDELSTPSTLGLVWINAPKPGQKYGGANCGGVEGGDDCDHYLVKGKVEKWDVPDGFCRVLQHQVGGGDVCTAWHADNHDELPIDAHDDAHQWRECRNGAITSCCDGNRHHHDNSRLM